MITSEDAIESLSKLSKESGAKMSTSGSVIIMDETKKALIKCDCGCGIIELIQWDFQDWDDVSVSYYPLGFYAYQKVWLEKLKAIWKILTGKYYDLYSVSVSKEEFYKKIKNFLEEKEGGV